MAYFSYWMAYFSDWIWQNPKFEKPINKSIGHPIGKIGHPIGKIGHPIGFYI